MHTGGSQRMWMSDHVLMNLGASSVSVILVNTAVSAVVSIHTFGAIGLGMPVLLAFLIVVSIFSQFQLCSLHILLQCMMVDLCMVEEVH